jgi:predicted naringenin-chalcone synthase
MSRVLESSTASRRRDRALELLERLGETSGIDRRYSVLPDFAADDPAAFRFFPRSWDLEPFPTTAERMRVYERTSVDLAEEAARRALEQAGIAAADVDHLLVCTCTGFFAPGPDILLIRRLGLREDVLRTILGFMGCHAGLCGLRVADDVIRARPDAVVLQVSVELCSLHYQKKPDPQLVVANSLFADGCGAAVYGSSGRFRNGKAGYRVPHSLLGQRSLGHMAWRIGDTGFEMRLSPAVPDCLRTEVAGFVDALLAHSGVPREEVRGWAIHPGGRRIVEVMQEALELDERDVQVSLSTLKKYGNMSSGTIFFVLDEMLRNGGLEGPVVALGFGPGLTFEGAVLSP